MNFVAPDSSPGLQGAPQGVSQASDHINAERERAR